MVEELRVHQVEVSFVGLPPTQQVERASGVSDVNVDGRILRCLVFGSFQPFLEALRGHEVVSLTSLPIGPSRQRAHAARRGRQDRRDLDPEPTMSDASTDQATAMLLVTFEILLTIVTPLLALYLRGRWPLRTVTVCLFAIPVVWYLAYAPIHELSHALGVILVGGKVVEIKLIPSFWEGTFAVAWVKSEGLGQLWPIMTGAPYVLDVASVALSLVVLRRRLSRNALVVGLLLTLLCLRPTFDLVGETIGFVGGSHGDLWHLQMVIGSTGLWSFLLAALALCLVSVVVILRRYGGFPEPSRPPRLARFGATAASI